LRHPESVRAASDTCKLNSPGREFDKETIAGTAADLSSSTLHRKEIGGGDLVRMSQDEKVETKPIDFVPIEDGMEYRKFDGIWYFHEFVEVEVKMPVFLRGSFNRWNIDKQAVSKLKRQLGKKQLKKLGLQNT
jgi:hypothetical protein